ncbi:ExbD/TolR family protein [Parasphingopyxis marina]|uniref:Biopolymer transporter ExbD n=1 Tax=Parasphingopyxis marina TaxID=2761622 RepID=A0A842I3A1_9SPHN|nr:biopolymer transporter ExbD [Parasphingopyxis marina]MBC2778434.1 biopolymer transporter ExbD [Parasphingopyxis marina]
MGAKVASEGGDDEPMMDINTTPLIDVMLVLLIMFIITIPIQTHAVKIDLPVASDEPPPENVIDPVKNEVYISPTRQILWNGEPVTTQTLRQYLDITVTMSPVPELHMFPDPQADYNMVDEVLAVTRRAQVSNMGFIGNENYRNF